MKKDQKKSMFSSKLGKVVGIATAIALSATSAQADMDLSGVKINTDDATNVGLLVLAAVAVLWGVKKAISFGNRG